MEAAGGSLASVAGYQIVADQFVAPPPEECTENNGLEKKLKLDTILMAITMIMTVLNYFRAH